MGTRSLGRLFLLFLLRAGVAQAGRQGEGTGKPSTSTLSVPVPVCVPTEPAGQEVTVELWWFLLLPVESR